MEFYHAATDFFCGQPSAVTLGKFDGLHRGHQKLVDQIIRQKAAGLASVVFVIAPPGVPRILTSQEMHRKLESKGVDCLIECPYVPEILSMSPEQFLKDVLIQKLHARYLAVGTDFHFGYQRSGDADFLRSMQSKYHFRTDVIEKECFENREISSTYVREAMKKGEIELVSHLLGYPFSISGTVQHGRQLGRRIGMPTLNLIPPSEKLLPRNGVYYSRTLIDGAIYQSITNIGSKPTVDGTFLGAETYLYDFSEDMYGKEITVELLSFRRPEQRFASVEELKAQMQKDISSGKEYFCEN
ncbi:MAG: bifunctional riboflavin kinase/FAD synthetase [Lachnospiraceae bacterium]|nr:bifunctional riboflavin kinase/FAD synthetase [Lachnospiraceae bacterium]